MTNVDDDIARRLRYLDLTDVYILRSLHNGDTLTSIAKLLFVTQPAISQRMAKMQDLVFQHDLIYQPGRRAFLTSFGKLVCLHFSHALKELESIFQQLTSQLN